MAKPKIGIILNMGSGYHCLFNQFAG